MMTKKTKQEFIAEIITLLEKRIEITEENSPPVIAVTQNQPVEMLTIKECTEAVSGLSEHTVRQLVKQGKADVLNKQFDNCKKLYEVYGDIADTYYTISKGDYISKLVEEKKREEEEKLKKPISRGR